jgi:hypothetical protein
MVTHAIGFFAPDAANRAKAHAFSPDVLRGLPARWKRLWRALGVAVTLVVGRGSPLAEIRS